VDELAGEVFSSISSPFAYKISVYSEIEKKKNEINAKLYSAIPEFKSNTYSIGFKPHVDFSFSNPVSLEARIGNGRNLGSIFFRIREIEASLPLHKSVSLRGGYSFKNNSWYVEFSGRVIPLW
jgi:hypothetical protein